ncbi:MAG: hypothetical protein ABH887_02100 [bacterium]
MSNLEYKKFRVRSPVKSFRDLEVYQVTVILSAELFKLSIPAKYKKNVSLMNEVSQLQDVSKSIPRLIVESYGDKFSSLDLAGQKLEQAIQNINGIVMKIDFLNAIVEENVLRENLLEISKKYQRIKIKILNLKRAWYRVFGDNPLKYGEKNQNQKNFYRNKWQKK